MEFEGLRVPLATAEDVVLAKLEWPKLGESARQVEDAAAILRARWAELDARYLQHWVRELGIEREWEAALPTHLSPHTQPKPAGAHQTN